MMKDELRMMKDDDFKLLRGFEDGGTNERTDEQTFLNVESLSRLKNKKVAFFTPIGVGR